MTEYYTKLCKCGCGKTIPVMQFHRYYGIPEYLRGHNCRGKKMPNPPWNKGKSWPEEMIRKMSEAHTGKRLSPEASAVRNAKRLETLKVTDPNGLRFEKSTRTRRLNLASGAIVQAPCWNKGTKRPPEFGALIKKKAIERHFTNNMRPEICRLYVEEGLSTKKIGKMLGTNGGVISKRLKEEGIQIRGTASFDGTEKYGKGRRLPEETMKRLQIARVITMKSPESLARRREKAKGKPPRVISPEAREKISAALTGRHPSEETRNKFRQRRGAQNPSFGVPKSEECREKISESLKKKWFDREYVLMMAEARGIRPNKPESILIGLLDEMYPDEWKYTGDFSFTINGKNPDFVNCNGQKKVIEFNGTYWHRNDTPGDREKMFAEFGYDTLVIWDKEMKDMESVKNKIRDFHEQRAV